MYSILTTKKSQTNCAQPPYINMVYQLSVGIFGPGISERAHWGFIAHQPPNRFGELLHVRVIDAPANRFIFENRSGHALGSQNAWGLCKIAPLDDIQRSKATSILSSEKPPNGGTNDCQNWLLDGLVSLEVDGLVSDGTAQVWKSRIGKQTAVIKNEAGVNWEPLNGR